LDDDSLSGLIALFVLILLHALLALAFASLANIRANALKDQSEEGSRRAKRAYNLIMHSATHLSTTNLTLTTLLRFAIAAVAVLNVADPLIASSDALNPGLTYALVVIITALVTLIVGTIVPEAVGSRYAEPLALLSAGPMRWLVLGLSPVVTMVIAASRTLSSALGSGNLVNTVTEEEIMTLVDAGHFGGTIEEDEKEMIYSVLQLDQTRASEVMIPRIDIVAIDIEQTLSEAVNVFVESGFSRVPVYEDNIDSIKGLLYAKDLLHYLTSTNGTNGKSIANLLRTAYFVPENKQVDTLLRELRNAKVHIAIVVDEYGGTAGLVTIENIIEEIIGDIQDEYDVNEEAEYVQQGPDEFVVDASIDLDDFNDLLDLNLPTEDSDTLGGYIYTHFGRVPLVDEIIDIDEVTIHIREVEGRRIRKVHVIRKRPEGEGGTGDAQEGEPAEPTRGRERSA
jgi:putative hemolysin